MQVTYTQGAPPNMFMKDADGNTVEEIGIANWKVEHIEEFRAPAPALKSRTARPLRGQSAQRCQPRQPPRSFPPCGSCREARPGGHRVSAGRRWVTFMTRGAKSSLSRWRCAESVVTLSLGYSRVPGPDYQPVALGATVDAFRSTPRRAPSVCGPCCAVPRPAYGSLVLL